MKLVRLIAVASLACLVSCSKSAPPAPQPKPAPPAPAEQASAGDPTPFVSAGLVEGEDFVLIPDGVPFDTPAGQVEIAEFFNYACPACNSFEPKFEAWKQQLPAYAHVIYVPMDFRPDFVPYARAYYAAQALGVAEKSHEAVYRAIHEARALPGEGSVADEDQIARFYAQFGANAAEFRKAMDSSAVSSALATARQFAARSQVQSTPSLVIDGRYQARGASFEDVLEHARQLIIKAHP